MLTLLNAGFGRPIGQRVLGDIRAFGFHGVRQDIPDSDKDARAVIAELATRPNLYPIFLVGGGKMQRGNGHSGVPWTLEALLGQVQETCRKLSLAGYLGGGQGRPCAIEVGNEPDIADKYWSRNPSAFGELVDAAAGIVYSFDRDAVVISGGVSNLNRRGIGYLENAARQFPERVRVGIHRYPAGETPVKAHRGFASRREEIQRLKQVLGGRKFWVTETGRSELEQKRFLFWTWLKQVDNMGAWYEYEHRLWLREGAEGFVWYQLNDGPRRQVVDRYGIRKDRIWKQVTKTIEKVNQCAE